VHAARRELWEETGIVAPPKLLKQRQVAFITLPGFSYVFWMFSLSLNDVPAITLSPYEHDDYRWVTVEEMLELKEKERLFPYTYECLQVLGT
jgi:8-oxo-dGTP pyrophosphatase MutT (NUDIX family)